MGGRQPGSDLLQRSFCDFRDTDTDAPLSQSQSLQQQRTRCVARRSCEHVRSSKRSGVVSEDSGHRQPRRAGDSNVVRVKHRDREEERSEHSSQRERRLGLREELKPLKATEIFSHKKAQKSQKRFFDSASKQARFLKIFCVLCAL